MGLPKTAERKKIFRIHIKKRREQDLKNINILELAEKTDGYSGADIEGVVKEAVEWAFTQDASAVTTEYILKAINNTKSLSVIMDKEIKEMSKEYEKRHFKNASC